jgi:hypothetical protein
MVFQYTNFSLSWSPTPPPQTIFHDESDATTFTVVVKNTGTVFAASEAVLAFFKPTVATITSLGGAPTVIKQLFDFDKVFLEPGDTTTLTFTVNATQLGLVDLEGHTSLHPGQYSVVFSRGCVGCSELTAPVTIAGGSPIRLKTFRKWW